MNTITEIDEQIKALKAHRINILKKDQSQIEEYLNENNFENLKGYEGLYKINKTHIWSCCYKKKMEFQEKEGYLYLDLTNVDKQRKKCYFHRLLAIQYIPNPNNLPEIDHIDRVRSNNSIDNLRWADKQIQNNNKKDNIENKTEEEKIDRITDIKEYKRKWAEKNRRENGIQPKAESFDAKKYARDWAKAKRASLTDEERAEINLKRREERKLKKAIA